MQISLECFAWIAESMMSPSPAPITEPTLDNVSAERTLEPRFVLTTAPESPAVADTASKSQCSSLSDGENYECYGEGVELDLDSGIASDRNNG